MTKTPAQILREARALIEAPERWTTGALARHVNDNPIGPREANAACWCALGAVQRFTADGSDEQVEAVAYLQCAAAADGDWIVYINDHVGHDAVLRMYDRAIALAE